MIEIRNLKVSAIENTVQLERLIMKKLRVKQVPEYQILKRSIDARKKPEIYYIYTVGILDEKNPKFLKCINNNDIMLTNKPD